MALGSTSISGQSRQQLRNQMLTSVHGRRLGLDPFGYEVGFHDNRKQIDNIGTTAATSLIESGMSVLSATPASSAVYTLLAPTAGVYKQITQISTPAVGFDIQLGANANIVTSAGSSFNQVTIKGVGAGVCLSCISSSTANGPIWALEASVSTGITFSTY